MLESYLASLELDVLTLNPKILESYLAALELDVLTLN